MPGNSPLGLPGIFRIPKFNLLKGLPMITIRLVRFTVAACVTTTIAFCFATIAHSQTIDTSHVLSGKPRCDHVISLVMRHGVNRSVDNSSTGQLAGSTPFGLASIASNEIGDLQIVSVQRCADVPELCGPRFTIVVMNQSQHRVDGVDVSVVALLGAIQPLCPNATVRTCAIEPFTAAQVEVTLPIEALSMGNHNGAVIGFQKLVVAIDSRDEWIEVNEANNVQALFASAIPVAATLVTQVSTDVSRTEVVPNESTPVAPSQSIGSIQSPSATTGTVDVDELRLAVEKLGANTAEVAGSTN